jgi:hypothetical protein
MVRHAIPMAGKMLVDYSLCLVADSAESAPRSRDLVKIVQAAIEGGKHGVPHCQPRLTVVQV